MADCQSTWRRHTGIGNIGSLCREATAAVDINVHCHMSRNPQDIHKTSLPAHHMPDRLVSLSPNILMPETAAVEASAALSG